MHGKGFWIYSSARDRLRYYDVDLVGDSPQSHQVRKDDKLCMTDLNRMMLEILESEGCGWMVRTEDDKDVCRAWSGILPLYTGRYPHELRTEYLYMLHSHVHFIQLAIISIHFFNIPILSLRCTIVVELPMLQLGTPDGHCRNNDY